MPNSWYVYVLFFYYIVFAVCGRFLNKPIQIVSMLFGATIALILFTSAINLGDWWWKSSFAFNVGTLLPLLEKNRRDEINIAREKNLMFFIFAILVVSAIPNVFGLSYYKVRSILMIVLTTILPFYLYIAFKRVPFLGNKVLLFLGSISYEMYLIHGIVLILVSDLLPDMKPVLCIMAVYLVTIVFSLLVSIFSRWLNKNMNF